MASFEMITDSIGRLTIPFEDIYTSVFLIKCGDRIVLFDTATYPSDVEDYIIPALEAAKCTPDYIFLSHSHRDHAGGLEKLMREYPDTVIVSLSKKLCEQYGSFECCAPADCEEFVPGLKAVHIPGHAQDAMGLLHVESGILLSGDCLQVEGIFGSGNWGSNITAPKKHIEAIQKLRGLCLSSIIASHDYHPCGWRADGVDEINRYLDGCVNSLYSIRDFIMSYLQLDDAPIAEMYNSSGEKPTVGAHVFKAVRTDFC